VILKTNQGKKKGYVFKVAPDILLESWALDVTSLIGIRVPKFTTLDDFDDLIECFERVSGSEKFPTIRSKLRHFSYSHIMVMEYIENQISLNDLKRENLVQLGQILALDVFLYNADGVPCGVFHSLGNPDNILVTRDSMYVIDRQMPTVRYSTMSPEMKSQQIRRLQSLIYEAKKLLNLLPREKKQQDTIIIKENANDLKKNLKIESRVAERFMKNFRDSYDLKEDEIKMAVKITTRSDKLHLLFQNERFRKGYLSSQIRDNKTREQFPKFSTARDFLAFNTKSALDIKLSGMQEIAKGFLDAASKISCLKMPLLYRFPSSIKEKIGGDEKKKARSAALFERCDVEYFKEIMKVMSECR
jgi:hypothetical protein